LRFPSLQRVRYEAARFSGNLALQMAAKLSQLNAGPARIGAHAVHRRGWRCRKGREGSPGIYASLCERRPHPMRCALLFFGTAKQISILKNAASGVAGGLRPLAVGTILRRLASFLVLHKALPFAADYLLPHQVSTLPRQGRTFLCMDSARSWSSLGMIRTRLR
jgi:hypothetical protein